MTRDQLTPHNSVRPATDAELVVDVKIQSRRSMDLYALVYHHPAEITSMSAQIGRKSGVGATRGRVFPHPR